MSKPKTPEQKPTAQEIAQFEIAQQQWQEYQDTAPPLQEMYQRLTTGYVPDGEGGLQLAGNVLRDDGSVRTDVGQQQAAASRAWSGALNAADDPNRGAGRMGQMGLLQQRMASEAQTGQQARLGQQNNYLQAVENVISMGRGQQAQALSGMQQQAGQAAQQAAADANKAFADKSANRYLLGSGLGALGGYYMYKNSPYGSKQATPAGATPGFNPIGGFNLLGGG